jgi:hypothetical protein
MLRIQADLFHHVEDDLLAHRRKPRRQFAKQADGDAAEEMTG